MILMMAKKSPSAVTKTQKSTDSTNSHMQNFVDGVQTRSNSKLRSESAVAAKSSAMAHMANVSYQLAGKASTEALETAFGESVQQRDMLARLRESTMIYAMKNSDRDVSQPWLLGQALSFNNSTMQFEGSAAEAANKKNHSRVPQAILIFQKLASQLQS